MKAQEISIKKNQGGCGCKFHSKCLHMYVLQNGVPIESKYKSFFSPTRDWYQWKCPTCKVAYETSIVMEAFVKVDSRVPGVEVEEDVEVEDEVKIKIEDISVELPPPVPVAGLVEDPPVKTELPEGNFKRKMRELGMLPDEGNFKRAMREMGIKPRSDKIPEIITIHSSDSSFNSSGSDSLLREMNKYPHLKCDSSDSSKASEDEMDSSESSDDLSTESVSEHGYFSSSSKNNSTDSYSDDDSELSFITQPSYA